jgi:copper chaperone CopZ
MQTRRKWCVALAVLVALVCGQGVPAADPASAVTLIAVEGMCCKGCAKKVVGKLTTVPGVAAVRADVKASTVTVTARADAAPSPRALWEAVEKAGHKPLRLAGPAGTFAAKPQS